MILDTSAPPPEANIVVGPTELLERGWVWMPVHGCRTRWTTPRGESIVVDGLHACAYLTPSAYEEFKALYPSTEEEIAMSDARYHAHEGLMPQKPGKPWQVVVWDKVEGGTVLAEGVVGIDAHDAYSKSSDAAARMNLRDEVHQPLLVPPPEEKVAHVQRSGIAGLIQTVKGLSGNGGK